MEGGLGGAPKRRGTKLPFFPAQGGKICRFLLLGIRARIRENKPPPQSISPQGGDKVSCLKS